ncbi:MAG: precorrin-2 C(20)-methyltransferase [Deltaproteobacteria bacterium]|nr:precorrin-2 C(20)-methyltransferase [Deltaproteobacteria bacterium]MBW2020137.1 precorrin-2 C(20)-methyltransferase [Deltaproteobacteria bacterium]MBW2075738.1 precorrin-2 C(20)-methyltransferase [Deltaproteobacteria bacterium]RLB81631.1 MAG: precorrin-2 C(20)-methyltransferase [Deltaproteobacteria bacterium]
MKQKTGKFFGVGVGPGDPELISLKAVRILGSVHTIFAASSSKNSHSVAMRATRPHLPQGTPVIRLSFPMTSDRKVLKECWEQHAATIVEELEKGKDVAFITLGDPLTYSTYGYIAREVKKIAPYIEIETVPGIASYQAAAALVHLPLAEGEESLLVLSGSKGGEHLRRLGRQVDNIVMLKAYRHFQDIYSVLKEMNLAETTIGITCCGQPDEKIVTDIKEMVDKKPNYFTLLIVKNKKT